MRTRRSSSRSLEKRASCEDTLAGLQRAAGLPAQRSSSSACRSTPCPSCTSSTTSRSSAAMRLSRLIDEAVAAPPEAGAREARDARARDAVRSTACCCSTSRSGLTLERRAAAREAAASAPRRPATPARSIRWPRPAAAAASARRPSSPVRCSTPTRHTSRRVQLGRSHRRPATPKARCSTRTPVDVDAATHRRGAARASAARSSRCRRCTRRSSTRARRCTSYARARQRGRARAAPRHDPRSSSSSSCDGADADAARRVQQGHLHPHAGRGHRRGARLRRAPGGAAAHGDRRASASSRRSPSTRWRRWRRPSAARGCCRSTRCSRTCRALELDADEAAALAARAGAGDQRAAAGAVCGVYGPTARSSASASAGTGGGLAAAAGSLQALTPQTCLRQRISS